MLLMMEDHHESKYFEYNNDNLDSHNSRRETRYVSNCHRNTGTARGLLGAAEKGLRTGEELRETGLRTCDVQSLRIMITGISSQLVNTYMATGIVLGFRGARHIGEQVVSVMCWRLWVGDCRYFLRQLTP